MHKKLQDLPTSSVNSRLTLDGIALSELAPEPVAYPLVTFIVRNWNYGRFVGAAIRSVRNQDYPNLEAIVVDNGSTDDSRSEIEAAIGDDPRFRTIWLDRNFGGLAAGLAGLDVARGDFVCFVDSDDYLLTNFAATHVQVHLSLQRSVALTSNEIIEVDGDGALINAGRRWAGDTRGEAGLGDVRCAPRLSEIGDHEFREIDRKVTSFSPQERGWLWSPGTANMFRRFVVETMRPTLPRDAMLGLSVDSHFCHLAHAFGGSARIGLPLSAYRLHADNSYITDPHLPDVRPIPRKVGPFIAARRREAMRVLLQDAAKLSFRLGEGRFWSAIEQVLGNDTTSAAQQFNMPETQAIVADNLPVLFDTFGRWRALRKLREMMSRKALSSILQAANRGDAATRFSPRMVGIEIEAFAFSLRKRLRAARKRRKRR